MTDNEIKREKTFSEELPYFKERIKEVFDNYDNPNGNEDPLRISVLRDSKRIVRKAEEEIKRRQEEIDRLKATVDSFTYIGKLYSEIKAEAIKEFAERLKNEINIRTTYSREQDKNVMRMIDNLVKEMIYDE